MLQVNALLGLISQVEAFFIRYPHPTFNTCSLLQTRKAIPERLKPLKSLLPQVESLDNGISDLTRWVDTGEQLLASHKVDGDINLVEDRLEKHKVGSDLRVLTRVVQKRRRTAISPATHAQCAVYFFKI